MSTVCKYLNTGEIVEFIGYHDELFAQVRAGDGRIFYPPVSKLQFYDPAAKAEGKPNEPVPPLPPQNPERDPEGPVLPVDTRLNLNAASAEMMTKVDGIGYATAKKIVELRNSLPMERFSDLAQLRAIPRVNWDEVIEDDQIYLG